MIAFKLIFQSLAGTVALVGCLGGGYYVINNEPNNFYLVSSATTESEKPTTDLWTAVTEPNADVSTPSKTKDIQQYQCKSTTLGSVKEKLGSCEVFSIAFDSTNKSILLSDIQTFIADPTKKEKITRTEAQEDLKSKHFFLLKTSSSFLPSEITYGTQTIKLPSLGRSENEKNKNYATLTVVAKISKTGIVGKTNFLIGKATALDTTTNNLTLPVNNPSDLICKFSSKPDKDLKPCVFKALSEYQNNTFNFSSLSTPLTQEALTIAKDNFYLIKWTGDKQPLLNSLKTDSLKISKPESSTTFTEFKELTAVFAHPTTTGTTSTFTEVIIVK